MKKFISILLCAVLALSLFTACGDDSDAPYVPTGDALSYGEDYTGPAVTEPVEKEEQDLSLVYYAEESMHPYVSTNFTNRMLFSLIYQSLFVVDKDYNVHPMLCSSYTRSRDLKRYDFYIDENARFSDGSPVTAQDVVASLTAARSSTLLSGRFRHVRGISVTDDGAVRISLYNPSDSLPLLLDIPITKEVIVAAPLETEGEADADTEPEPEPNPQLEFPLGSGPYYWDATGPSPRLVRNNFWWCKSEDLLITDKEITLVAAESPSHIRDQFEFEDVGLVCADPGSDSYADYRCDFELWECETGMFVFLTPNKNSGIFSNRELRVALTYAIDRNLLVDKYYRGFARGASLPASPASPYYNLSLSEKYDFDQDQFSIAVRNAGVQGRTVKLLVNSNDSLRTRAAREIALMLNNCGLVVEVDAKPSSAYLKALRNGEFDLYLGQTKLSANMDLTAFFTENGNMAFGELNDPETLMLCTQSLENIGNYYTLHKTIMDEGMFCPVLFRSYAVYAERGLLTDLQPSRDNVCFYTIGKDMTSALKSDR